METRVSDHQPNQTYAYIFDTCVWLYIFGPVANSNSRKQKIYAGLLQSILSRSATIYITSQVVSEYINRVIRFGFESWKKSNGLLVADFKHDYRDTTHYSDTLNDAIVQINEILRIAQRRPDDFNAISIQDVTGIMTNKCDYIDAYLIKTCEIHHFNLVSDDNDIISTNCPITVIHA